MSSFRWFSALLKIQIKPRFVHPNHYHLHKHRSIKPSSTIKYCNIRLWNESVSTNERLTSLNKSIRIARCNRIDSYKWNTIYIQLIVIVMKWILIPIIQRDLICVFQVRIGALNQVINNNWIRDYSIVPDWKFRQGLWMRQIKANLACGVGLSWRLMRSATSLSMTRIRPTVIPTGILPEWLTENV